jgi:hypothetical protein
VNLDPPRELHRRHPQDPALPADLLIRAGALDFSMIERNAVLVR